MSEKSKDLSAVFVYSQDFMERVIRNLINDPSYCKSCGLYRESCKYNVYSFVRKVRAAIQLPKPADLPAFVDNTEEFMPKKLPEADLCLASELHRDLLLELPEHLKKSGHKGTHCPPRGLARSSNRREKADGAEMQGTRAGVFVSEAVLHAGTRKRQADDYAFYQ